MQATNTNQCVALLEELSSLNSAQIFVESFMQGNAIHYECVNRNLNVFLFKLKFFAFKGVNYAHHVLRQIANDIDALDKQGIAIPNIFPACLLLDFYKKALKANSTVHEDVRVYEHIHQVFEQYIWTDQDGNGKSAEPDERFHKMWKEYSVAININLHNSDYDNMPYAQATIISLIKKDICEKLYLQFMACPYRNLCSKEYNLHFLGLALRDNSYRTINPFIEQEHLNYLATMNDMPQYVEFITQLFHFNEERDLRILLQRKLDFSVLFKNNKVGLPQTLSGFFAQTLQMQHSHGFTASHHKLRNLQAVALKMELDKVLWSSGMQQKKNKL